MHLKQALFLIALLPTPSLAQTNSQPCRGRALTGTVQDSTAAMIPGATISLDDTTQTTSGPDGHFRLPCLSAGPHTLTVAAPGFATRTLTLKPTHPVFATITLTPADSTTIDVNANAPQSSPPLGGVNGTTLSGTQLQNLADDPDDLLRELQQLAATSGGNPANATISVDGFQGDSPVPPKSSIAFVRVNPDLYSAEYRDPPYGGGLIQIFTKPGAKTYHGALFTTNSSQFENARDPFSDAPAAIGKQRYGFELSGPVRRQGSNFSLALEHRSINDFAVVNAIALSPAFTPVSVVQNVSTPQQLWLGSARVDAQLGPKNIAFVAYSADVNHLENVGAGGNTLIESGYSSGTYDHTVRFSDITTVSPALVHEARLSLESRGETDVPNSTAPQLQVAGFFTGGGASIGQQRINQFRTEYDDDILLNKGKHALKTGLQLFLYKENQTLTTNFNGTYIFGGGTAPVLDANNNPTAQTETITGLEQYRRALLNLAGGTPTQYSNVAGNPQVDFTEIQSVFFLQDDWKLRPNLTLSVGLRYFVQSPLLQDNGITPRAGLAWTPDARKTLTLHAHVGLFSGNSPNGVEATEAEILREDGTARVTSLVYLPAYNPTGAPSTTGTGVVHSLRVVSPHFGAYQDLLSETGLDKTFPHGWSFSAFASYETGKGERRTLNINTPFNGSPTGPRPFAPNLNIYQLQSSGFSFGDIEFAGIGNQSFKRLQFFVGAVRVDIKSDADDNAFASPQSAYTDAGELARETGNSVWETFGNLSLKLPEKVQLSTNYYGNGNTPFNITTGFDNNGDGDFNDRPQYAAPGTPNSFQTPFGTLIATGGTGTLPRNLGNLPWNIHLDANLQRAFLLTRNPKAEHKQTVTVNVRSSNLLNHTNVTAEGGILGSAFFLTPYQADSGRRVEFGLRYSF